jgi:hypothetical protein
VAEALGLEAHQLLASAATWESDRAPADPAMAPPPPPPAARGTGGHERWFHADSLAATPELPEVLARIAAALDRVPDERAELALMLSLDERRTRRMVREELDRRSER